MNSIRVWMKRVSLVALVAVALTAAAAVRADGPEVVEGVEGVPLVTPGRPAGSDQIAVENQPPTPEALSYDYDIYVSAPGNGQIFALSYADEDILRYSTKTGAWAKVFDGTNEGLPASADIDALAFQPITLGQIYYMSFDTPVAVPGLGVVDDSDIVAHRYVFGQTATWSLYFDGSAHGLTTDAEDIDAFDIDGPVLRLSTAGGFAVPKVGGGTLKGPDEDIIVFASASNAYARYLDGTTIGLAGTNDIRGYAYLRVNDRDLGFYVVQRPAQLKYPNWSYPAVPLAVGDIGVDERPTFAPWALGVIWDASAAGFPKVDAFDVVKK